jgi:hypothetical protein
MKWVVSAISEKQDAVARGKEGSSQLIEHQWWWRLVMEQEKCP